MAIDIPDFIDQYEEDEGTVRARMDITADPEVNKEEGDFYQTLTQPSVIEDARQWESLNDVLRNTTVLYAVGQYLDYIAAGHNITRKQPTYASGEVTFTGTNGTFVDIGTIVSSTTTSEAQPAVRFVTQEAGTVSGGTLTVNVVAEEPGLDGNVTASAIEVMDTNITGITAVTNAEPMSGGSDLEGDEELRQRVLSKITQPQAAGSSGDYERWALEEAGVGAVTVTPNFNGSPHSILLTLLDTENNPVSQSIMDSLQRRLSGPIVLTDPSSALTAAQGAAGVVPIGVHNYKVTFYDSQDGETKGGPVGSVTVSASAKTINLSTIPVGPAGTVGRRIYRQNLNTGAYKLVKDIADNTTVATTDNLAVGTTTMPMTNNTTQFMGIAPVGAWIFVDTPTPVSIAIVATVTFESGYSLDGTGGTIALRESIEQAIEEYIDSLRPGEDVVFNHVRARFFDVGGVYDVTALTVNTGTSNIAIATSEVAAYATPTLS
jgi:uncharacterized phage protein gp47/JayE